MFNSLKYLYLKKMYFGNITGLLIHSRWFPSFPYSYWVDIVFDMVKNINNIYLGEI